MASSPSFASDEPIPSPEVSAESAKKISFTFQDDVVSRYVWRGFALSRGPVMQPAFEVEAYGFIAEIWSNFVLNNEHNQGRFSEVDPSLEYHYHLGPVEIVPAFEGYIFINQPGVSNTAEAQLRLSYTVHDLTLTTSQNFDVVHSPGGYYGDFSIGYERELVRKLSLQTATGIGWADAKFNAVNGGLSQAALNVFFWRLGFTWSALAFLDLTPHLDVNVILDPDLRAAQADPTLVSGGLLASLHF